MWVPTWVPMMIMSLAAQPPSARTMSPCRRGSVCQNGGWLGDCGIPTVQLPAEVDDLDSRATIASSGSSPVVILLR